MKDDIKSLIRLLSDVKTEYHYESKYIGRAVSYLHLLLTILETRELDVNIKSLETRETDQESKEASH